MDTSDLDLSVNVEGLQRDSNQTFEPLELITAAKTTGLIPSASILDQQQLAPNLSYNPPQSATSTKKFSRFLGLKRKNSITEQTVQPSNISNNNTLLNNHQDTYTPSSSLSTSPQSPRVLRSTLLSSSQEKKKDYAVAEEAKAKKKLFRPAAFGNGKLKTGDSADNARAFSAQDDLSSSLSKTVTENAVFRQMLDYVGLTDFSDALENLERSSASTSEYALGNQLTIAVPEGKSVPATPIDQYASENQTSNSAAEKGVADSVTSKLSEYGSLLTYPTVEPGKRASLTAIKEISLVRQRRQAVFCLTCYLLIMRFASFDLFIILLVLSNGALLYGMKNARKFNTAMAKRALRQRLGWAKQFVGGVFTKKPIVQTEANDTSIISEAGEEPEKSRRSKFFGKSATISSPNVTPPRQTNSSLGNDADSRALSGLSTSNSSSNDDLPPIGTRQQLKKILFFNRNRSHSGSTIQVTSDSGNKTLTKSAPVKDSIQKRKSPLSSTVNVNACSDDKDVFSSGLFKSSTMSDISSNLNNDDLQNEVIDTTWAGHQKAFSDEGSTLTLRPSSFVKPLPQLLDLLPNVLDTQFDSLNAGNSFSKEPPSPSASQSFALNNDTAL